MEANIVFETDTKVNDSYRFEERKKDENFNWGSDALSVWWFITISLDQDFEASKSILGFVKRGFTEYYAVTEHGENGKAHFHMVGLTQKRQDNIRSGFKRLLEKEDWIVGQYGLDIRLEPRPLWRVGYFCKEEDVTVLLNNLDQRAIDVGVKAYASAPKRERATEIRNGRFNLNELATRCRKECSTFEEVEQFINDICEQDDVPFTQWGKINWKRFRQYVLKNYKESD